MMKMLAAFGLLALAATTASASPYGTDSFVDAKTGYVVHVDRQGGHMVLTGRKPATGETFKVDVTDAGRVDGVWAGQRVNYVLPAAARR